MVLRSSHFLFVSGAAALFAACSINPANPLPTPQTTDPTETEQGNRPPHAGTTSGGLPQIPGSSGSSGSSETPKDTRLFPAEVGRSWTYSSETISQGQPTKGSSTQTITGQQMVDGRNAFVISSTQSTGTITSYADVQGDDIWVRSSADTVWLQTAKAPVEEGASWTYSYHGTRKQTWRKAGPQTVDAGSFDDCWRIDYVVAETSKPGDINYSIMCRGVGTVLTVMHLSNGFQMRQELTAKNF